MNLISELITCHSLSFIHTQPWELPPILQNIKVNYWIWTSRNSGSTFVSIQILCVDC